MSKSDHRVDSKPTKAAARDPWVGVHVLTEFIFCPRAGIVAYSEREDEEDEDQHEDQQQLDLSYRPSYSLRDLDRAVLRSLKDLARTVFRFLKMLVILPAGCCAAAGAILYLYRVLQATDSSRPGTGLTAILLLLAIGVIGLATLVCLVTVGVLWLGAVTRRLWAVGVVLINLLRYISRRVEARIARPREPDPNSGERQDVYWWSLLSAGFESIRYKDSLRDEGSRIQGKPWRVLRRGSLRIPVFRKRRKSRAWLAALSHDRKVYRQDYARLAAYCHLLVSCEGAESPYGIILYDNSYTGFAITIGQGAAAFHEGLTEARRVIRKWQNGSAPPSPDNSQLCRQCPVGKPVFLRRLDDDSSDYWRYDDDETDGNIYERTGADRRVYHSECGDYFRWTPPHQKAYDKGIIRHLADLKRNRQ